MRVKSRDALFQNTLSTPPTGMAAFPDSFPLSSAFPSSRSTYVLHLEQSRCYIYIPPLSSLETVIKRHITTLLWQHQRHWQPANKPEGLVSLPSIQAVNQTGDTNPWRLGKQTGDSHPSICLLAHPQTGTYSKTFERVPTLVQVLRVQLQSCNSSTAFPVQHVLRLRLCAQETLESTMATRHSLPGQQRNNHET